MRRLNRADVAGLIACLGDDDLLARIWALRALVRLPLAPEVWLRELTPYVSHALDAEPPAPAWYWPTLIFAAGRVPTRAARERVRELASASVPRTQWLAVQSLGEVRDPACVRHLLAYLESANEQEATRAAELLGRQDVSDERAEVRAAALRATPLRRFWLSLALARIGETDLFDEEMRQAGKDSGDFWSLYPRPGDWGTLAGSGPLPRSLVEHLRQLRDDPRLINRRIVALLLEEAEVVPEPPPPPKGAATTADVERRRALLARMDDWQPTPWPGSLAAIPILTPPISPEELALLTPKQGGELVSQLFSWAVQATPYIPATEFGNQVVRLIEIGLPSGFDPNIEQLLATYTNAYEETGYQLVNLQIAWAASRAPVRRLVSSTDPWLQVGPSGLRVRVAQFLYQALLYRSARQRPIFGGGAPPSEASARLGRLLDETDLERSILRRRPVVNTGIAPRDTPDQPLGKNSSLGLGTAYWFWMQVSEPLEASIEEQPTSLPTEGLPRDARLTVILFTFDGEIEIEPSHRVGEIQLGADGHATVIRQPAGDQSPASRHADRLFFPIRTTATSGDQRLRCCVYYRQVLVQSRVITLAVGVTGRLRSTLDYTLSRSLRPAALGAIQEHRLSVMLNGNGQGTHSLRFVGGQSDATPSLVCDAHFSASMLKGWIDEARGAMRQVCWSSAGPWHPGAEYRYADGSRDVRRLSADLLKLAQAGYNVWDRMVDELHCERVMTVPALRKLMADPAFVQIASREGVEHIVPAAVLYDQPHQSTAKQVCNRFLEALEDDGPLWKSDCFAQGCVHWADPEVVCPSGFWGYRHALGMPVSRARCVNGPQAWIVEDGHLQFLMAVATDFDLRKEHQRQVAEIVGAEGFTIGDTRARTIELLRIPEPNIVYFYCHGGIKGTAAYLHVGPAQDAPIFRSDLRELAWSGAHPLIIINGCQTTALEPEQTMEFVSAFVRNGAVGVIGTEITVFEALACDFAEACLDEFLVSQVSIGEAVRRARLHLLKRGNPLGLVYIPFVLATLGCRRPTRVAGWQRA